MTSTVECSAAEPGRNRPRRLTGGEIILVIVLTVIAAALTASGMTALTALEVVTGCSLAGVHLVRRAPVAPATV
ncbi:hypothetical protein [Streptomyces spirodelae]|uniref:Uncharacterized protein n=1 Tax=Streptomyces spirodelae TaxID=2812904 RepID=A0ABS3X1D7_9ACTN|nr:hypothetical protein [Streptomyces spirodelae]MBO8189195.1 hypothetical protein [Streptomyces spirodelae]